MPLRRLLSLYDRGTPEPGELSGGLVEALRDFRDFRRQQDSDVQFKRQNDLSEARNKRLDLLEKVRGAREAGKDREGILDKVIKSFREGGISEAEAVARASQYADPATGELRGIGAQRERELYRPVTGAPKTSLKEPTAIGERGPFGPPTEEEAENAAPPTNPGLYGMMGARKPPAPGLMGMLKRPTVTDPAAEAAPAEYGPAQERDTGALLVDIGGDKIRLDPRERDAWKQRQEAERAQRLQDALAERLRDPTLPAAERAQILSTIAATRGGATGAERAQVSGGVAQGAAETFKGSQAEKDRANALEKQRIANQRPRAANPGLTDIGKGLRNDKTKLDIEQEYTTAADTAAKNLGYLAMVKDRNRLDEMSTQIAGANDNAALASIVAGSFTKFAQGGTGVISDSDLRFFWQKLGGLGIRTQQAFEDAVTGRLTPALQKEVKEAVDTLIGRSATHEASIGHAIEADLKRLPGWETRVGPILESRVPNYYKNVYLPQKAKAGNPDAVQHMEDWADGVLKQGGH